KSTDAAKDKSGSFCDLDGVGRDHRFSVYLPQHVRDRTDVSNAVIYDDIHATNCNSFQHPRAFARSGRMHWPTRIVRAHERIYYRKYNALRHNDQTPPATRGSEYLGNFQRLVLTFASLDRDACASKHHRK